MTRAVFVSALYQMKQETEGVESMPAGETDLSPKPGGQSEEDGAEQSSPPVPAKDLFGDVTGDEWFVPALEWAAEQKIINGIDDGCHDTESGIGSLDFLSVGLEYFYRLYRSG